VCDGHGSAGHDVSKFIKDKLPEKLRFNINKRPSKTDSVIKILEDSFIQVNEELLNKTNIESDFSGSTCVSVLFTQDKLYCANLGDSRAIIGRCTKENKDNKTTILNWSYNLLSRDHKLSEIDEKERIIEKGGRVEPYQDIKGNFIGPMRVWLKEENSPGLAMSRSFGDTIAASVGVISEAEIFEWNLTKEDMFIVLASDGVWDFLFNQEVVELIKDFYLKDDISGAAEFLIEEATKRWINEDDIIDDITVILVFFENN